MQNGTSAATDKNLSQVIQIDEALMEMYLAGVSVRRVEDITESL